MNLTAVEQSHANIRLEIKKGLPVLFIDFVKLFRHVRNMSDLKASPLLDSPKDPTFPADSKS